jgi:S-(hydroxymethyl)glutathione dehydrogenase / alcohol dehydrogenase
METYISEELPILVQEQWSGVGSNGLKSICGHSMGGHGALTIAWKSSNSKSKQQQKEWVSVSALAPICHPTACPWGQKAFENYLGSVDAGQAHDATLLLQQQDEANRFDDILIDEGTSDNFGQAGQLLLADFEAVADKVGQKITVRRQEGFDHSYYFIAAFIADHIEFHSERLRAAAAASTAGK